MNDDEMLATMRRSLADMTESLTDVHLDWSADSIRGRARRRRLRRGLAAFGTGGLALGVGLAIAASGGPAPGARPVHVNLDAWSVNTLRSGLVYLDVRELRDPASLRRTLAAAGVPAIVTFGEFCTAASGGGAGDLHQILGKTAAGGEPRLTINPARIPDGSKLSIGIVSTTKRGVHGLDAAFGLVKDGARVTCGQPAAYKQGRGGKKGPGNPTGKGTVKTGIGS